MEQPLAGVSNISRVMNTNKCSLSPTMRRSQMPMLRFIRGGLDAMDIITNFAAIIYIGPS